MKYLIALIAAVLTFSVGACAHQKPTACGDGKSCCAKKK